MHTYAPPQREDCRSRQRMVRCVTTVTWSVCRSPLEPTSRRPVLACRCGGLPSTSRPRLCEAWRPASHRRNGGVRIAFIVRSTEDDSLPPGDGCAACSRAQLRCAPGDVRIVTGDLGKPRLACSDLRFSAARSAGIALYATSWTMEVGVDIEAIRTTADIDGIAARFMSPAEQRALASLPPTQRLAAFFQCWTRKEAYVKGIGTGLSFPLRDVDRMGRRPPTSDGVRLVRSPGRRRSRVRGCGRWSGRSAIGSRRFPADSAPRAWTILIHTDHRQAVAPLPWRRQGGDDVIAETREATVLPLIDQLVATEPHKVAVRAPDADPELRRVVRSCRPPGAQAAPPRSETRRPRRPVPRALGQPRRRRARHR